MTVPRVVVYAAAGLAVAYILGCGVVLHTANLADRRLDPTRGEVARWQHADQLPALWLSLRAAGEHGGYPDQPAHVRVSIWPGRIDAADPRELRQMAWCLLDAARWLDRQHGHEPAEPDPQTTIYDFVEAHP